MVKINNYYINLNQIMYYNISGLKLYIHFINDILLLEANSQYELNKWKELLNDIRLR